MSFGITCALFAYLAAAGCSIILLRSTSNWRIRFLALVAGLLPLCNAAILLSNHGVIVAKLVGLISEPMQLTISALCLSAVYLLAKENRDRKEVDVQLRLAEAQPTTNASFREARPTLEEGCDQRRTVERRREPRLPSDLLVTVAVLGTGVSYGMLGRVKDMSGSGLRLAVQKPIPNGSALKVEGDGLLLLAEVCRCELGAGEYNLGLQISECLDLPAALNVSNRAWNRCGVTNNANSEVLEPELLEGLVHSRA
jgi:hypothetical protein